ncbi:MAG: DUF3352 domain-containing protein [Gemmataceae bacterium]|nr:DUF3352 domain-containing protein [Gemmataceae bacterium]
MKLSHRSAFLLTLLVAPFAVGPALAQTPREELIRLVPRDIGFCLVIGDLRTQYDKLVRSPWIKAVRESPLGKTLLNAPEIAQFGKLEEALRKGLGVSWAQLRDDILGDAVVLAYRPGPPGKPEQEQGALMLWARNRELLARLVERLNEEQKRAGELKEIQSGTHRGLKYQRRVEKDGESFYHLDGPVLVFTAQEEMLLGILDQRANPKAPAALPMVERLRRVGTDKALATLWVNPRAFDAELSEQAKALKGDEGHALKAFLSYWRGLDGVSVALTVDGDPEVVLAAHARLDGLPGPARRLFAEAGKVSDLWGRFPKDSIFTAAARVDVPALFEAIGEFLTPEARKAIADDLQNKLGLPLNHALTKQILPTLGPDCGLCVLPPEGKQDRPQVLVALRVRPGSGPVPADRSLMQMLQLFAGLAVFEHNLKNKEPMHLKKETQEGVEVHYFSGKKFPPGVRPAFALKGGYLLLASSPEAVRRFAAEAGPLPDGPSAPLVRLSLQRLSRVLADRREPLLDFLMARTGLPREQAAERLEGFLSLLGLFDRVEVTQRTEGGRIDWVVRLQTFVPKK